MRMVLLFILLMTAAISKPSPAWSQQVKMGDSCKGTYDSLYRGHVLTFTSVMPEYPGGDARQNEFFIQYFRYPAQQVNLQMKVTVSYFVSPVGNIIHPHISGKSPAEYTLVDQEAIRVIKLMPRLTPGMCNGHKVAVKMVFRVNCMKLQE